VLTSGLPRERFGSSGFIDVPTIVTTQIEISYKLNGKLLPAAAAYLWNGRADRLNLFKPSKPMCPPSGKKGQNLRENIQQPTSNIEHPTDPCLANESDVGC
jgi:hypothetical protein